MLQPRSASTGSPTVQPIKKQIDSMKMSEQAAFVAQKAAAGSVAKAQEAYKQGKGVPSDGLIAPEEEDGSFQAPDDMGGWILPTTAFKTDDPSCIPSCAKTCVGICKPHNPNDQGDCDAICNEMCEDGCQGMDDYDPDNNPKLTMAECLPTCIADCTPACMEDTKDTKACAGECNEFCDRDCRLEIEGEDKLDKMMSKGFPGADDEEDDKDGFMDELGEDLEDPFDVFDFDKDDADFPDDGDDGLDGLSDEADDLIPSPEECRHDCKLDCDEECNEDMMGGSDDADADPDGAGDLSDPEGELFHPKPGDPNCKKDCMKECNEMCEPLSDDYADDLTDGDRLLAQRESLRARAYRRSGGIAWGSWFLMVLLLLSATFGLLFLRSRMRGGSPLGSYMRLNGRSMFS